MPKPGELWTLAQATSWISCTLGQFAELEERDGLISKLNAPVGEKERTPFAAYDFAVRNFCAVQADVGKGLTSRFKQDGEFLIQYEIGASFKNAWAQARTDLLDEVRRGQISCLGFSTFTNAAYMEIPKTECAAIEFREDFERVWACRKDDGLLLWQSIRFRAGEIVAHWPSQVAEGAEESVEPLLAKYEAPTKRKSRAGANPRYDWPTVRAVFVEECRRLGGPPHESRCDPDWRRPSDAAKLLQEKFQRDWKDGGPAKTTLYPYISKWSSEISEN